MKVQYRERHTFLDLQTTNDSFVVPNAGQLTKKCTEAG
jgi:hypothetical protein